MDIYTYNLCNLISKRKSSIGQNLIKIKHKVKWMVKIVKTPPHPPPSCPFFSLVDSFLHMVFKYFVNILKRLFFERSKI